MSGSFTPPNVRWKSSESTKVISDVVSQYSQLSFKYPTYIPDGLVADTNKMLIFSVYGAREPAFNQENGPLRVYNPVTCEPESAPDRSCSFVIEATEFSTFTLDIVANYDSFCYCSDQVFKTNAGDTQYSQNYYSITFTTIPDPCKTS